MFGNKAENEVIMYKIENLLDVLKQEDGYVEKRKNCPTAHLYVKAGPYAGADNWTKYWKDMADLGLTNYQGSYYCIATLFWAMVQAFGLHAAQELCLQKFMINCQKTHDLFKAKNQVYNNPKVGDIVTFWNGSRFNHAELVVYVNNDTVKTFGANTSAVTSTTVYNGGGCRYGKIYSLSAMQKSGAKFLRPEYGAQNEERWIQEGDQWRYQLEDKSFVSSSWRLINNKWYAFDENGYMRHGWFLDKNNQWYWLSGKDSGEMKTGWQLIDNIWYFFGTSGEMKTGWIQDFDGIWYYMQDPNGNMLTGLREIDGELYCFKENGAMISNAWQKFDSGVWRYFSSTGAAYKSRWKQESDGKYYYLKHDSIMATSCYIKDAIDNVYYWVDESGVWDEKTTSSSPFPCEISY